jgi:CheY-like chemotaxis protein
MAGGSRQVLVVDDDELIRGLVSQVLEREGYTIVEAADGQEALDALRDWEPALIVLDLRMPRMDGLTFLAEQRSQGLARDVPLIVLSATYTVGSHPTSKTVFLPKPFEPGELLATADQLVAQPSGGPAG